MNRQRYIGKHVSQVDSGTEEWLGYWPEVDDNMNVVDVAEGEEIPEGATLLWDDGTEADGTQGFDAFRR